MYNGVYSMINRKFIEKKEEDIYKKPFKKVCKGIFISHITKKDLEFEKVKVENIELAKEFFEGKSAIVGIVDKKYCLNLIYNTETCGYSVVAADEKTRKWLDYNEVKPNFANSIESDNLEEVLFNMYQRVLTLVQASNNDLAEVQLDRKNGEISINSKMFYQYGEILVSDNDIARICKRNNIGVRFTNQYIYFVFEI